MKKNTMIITFWVAILFISNAWAVSLERKPLIKGSSLISKYQFEKLDLRNKNIYIRNLQKIAFGFEVRQYKKGFKVSAQTESNDSLLNVLFPKSFAASDQCVIGGVLRNKQGDTCPTSGRTCSDNSSGFKCGKIFYEKCIDREPISTLSERCYEAGKVKDMDHASLNDIYNEFESVFLKMLKLCDEEPSNNPDGCKYLRKQLELIAVGQTTEPPAVKSPKDCKDGEEAVPVGAINCFMAPCPNSEWYICQPKNRDQYIYETTCEQLEHSVSKYCSEPTFVSKKCTELDLECTTSVYNCLPAHEDRTCPANFKFIDNYCHFTEDPARPADTKGSIVLKSKCSEIKYTLEKYACLEGMTKHCNGESGRQDSFNGLPKNGIRCEFDLKPNCKVAIGTDCPAGLERIEQTDVCYVRGSVDKMQQGAKSSSSTK